MDGASARGNVERETMTANEAIQKLISDPLYEVREDGTIWTYRSHNGGQYPKDPEQYKVGRTLRRAERLNDKGYLELRYSGVIIVSHRVVYAKFTGILVDAYEINHKDFNKQNNEP